MINKTSKHLRMPMKLLAFFYFRRSRALLLVFGVLVAVSAHAETKIHALTKVIEGHSTGGVTVDALGNIYVADFGEIVWKITPEGKREIFASGLYGASGNAIDHEGNLLQSNFYGDSVTKIDRKGQAQPFATNGLSGPVGIAISKQTGDVFVSNCRGNSIAKIAKDGTVSSFAKSDLFNCPNGIAFDGEGNLYVVNYRDNKMLKIDSQGAVALFTTISAKGLGHLCFNQKDRFYVTASQSHEIYEVMLDGTARRILGNGERGIVDGYKGATLFSQWNRQASVGATALHQRICQRDALFIAASCDRARNNSWRRLSVNARSTSRQKVERVGALTHRLRRSRSTFDRNLLLED